MWPQLRKEALKGYAIRLMSTPCLKSRELMRPAKPSSVPVSVAETLLRRHSPVAEAVLVLPVRGDGATLERALHLTMEQRATGETPILLADCGLDETGLRLAQSLTQRYSRVQLCPAEELENYLK